MLTGPDRSALQLLAMAAVVALASACTPSQSGRDNGPGAVGNRAAAWSVQETTTIPEVDPPSPTRSTYVAEASRLGLAGCPVFPDNNVFHSDITDLPVRESSDDTISAAGAELTLRAPTSFVWEGSRPGLPVNLVDSRTTPGVDVVGGTYSYLSDLEDHPIPDSPRIEGYPGMAWDRHMLVLDTATCVTSEFFFVTPPNPWFDRWTASGAVKMDLRGNAIRARGSANAAGMSLLAGMLRYDEVASGQVNHMIGISLPDISELGPVWPASRTDGRSADPHTPRMGTILRLKPTVDLSGLGQHSRVIAEAMQTHGLVVGDTGPDWINLAVENHSGWDDLDLSGMSGISLADFEVVDPEAMKVSDHSYEIR